MVQITFKPQAVIVDLRGVLANKNFELYSPEKKVFYKSKIRNFVDDDSLWERNKTNINLKHVYSMARVEQSARMKNKALMKHEPILDNTKDVEEMQDSLRNYILFTIDHIPQDRATGLFLEQMQIWGYTQRILKTPVYADVQPFFEKLKKLGIPIILTGASDRTFEQIMRNTTSGALLDYFVKDGSNKGHTQIDFKRNERSFVTFDLLENKRALFITHSSVSANKAVNNGIHVVIIVRDDYDPDWKKRVHETGSTIHTVGSLPIIAVNDQTSHDSDPPERPDDSEYTNSDDGLQLQPVSSKITSDDWKKFMVVTSLSEIHFNWKPAAAVHKTSSKPRIK